MSESEGYFVDDMFEYESDVILEKDAKIAIECQTEWNTVYLGYEKCPSCDRWVCENHLSDFDMETCLSCQETERRNAWMAEEKRFYCENCEKLINVIKAIHFMKNKNLYFCSKPCEIEYLKRSDA